MIKCFCINLQNQISKFEEVKLEFEKVGINPNRFVTIPKFTPSIKRFDLKSPNKSNMILNSHLDLLYFLKEQEDEVFLICEDEIIVIKEFDIDSIAARAPNDWSVIFFGGLNHFHNPVYIDSDEFYKCVYSFNSHCYLLKKDFIDTLIKHVENRDFEVDVIFANLQKNNIGNWYSLVDDRVIKNFKYGYSIITTHGENYNSLKLMKTNRIIVKKFEFVKFKKLSCLFIFNDICKKLLSYLDNTFPIIDKKSKNKSLIVESRWNSTVEFTIKNTIKKLGDGWGHIIFCTNDNYHEILNTVKNISQEIEIINLGDFEITRDSYNTLCLEIDFWNQVNCEKVLIYQSDTFIFKELDEEFLNWDYIGSPWGPSSHSVSIKRDYKMEREILLGNGGLSLRNVEAMKFILSNNNRIINVSETHTKYLWEDAFFSYYIEMSDKYRLAPLSVAQKFSFDSIYSDDNTFGCHKPFIDSNILESPAFTKFIEMVQGVNIIGFGNYQTGIGHNMRMVIDSIRKLKIPHTLQSLELDVEDIQFFENEQENYFSTNIVICNPDFGLVKTKIREKLKNKKNIGFWVWELESIPNEWIEESQFYDEIWTVSEFSQKSMQKCLPGKPVKLIKIPSVVNNIIEKKLAKEKLNLSNKFIVTFMFDGNSDVSRKNPHSVINSFLSSLSKFNDCVLIIKSQNLQKDDLVHLKSICRKENILLINKVWSSDEMSTLWSATDVYISLHRSEGSGLSIMESLYHGIPTITTNWSGNLDFCKKEFCELVDFDFVEIDKKSFFYKSSSNQRWADAKISDASEKLLNIYNNYEYYLNRTKLAKKFIDDEYNLVNLSEFILTNIEPNIQNQ